MSISSHVCCGAQALGSALQKSILWSGRFYLCAAASPLKGVIYSTHCHCVSSVVGRPVSNPVVLKYTDPGTRLFMGHR